jgi:hypothetical protein
MDILITGVLGFIGGLGVGVIGILTWAVLVAEKDKDS